MDNQNKFLKLPELGGIEVQKATYKSHSFTPHFHEEYGIGIIPMIGIGFHSLIDGFVYSIAFTVSIFTGFLATAGILSYKSARRLPDTLQKIRDDICDTAEH